MAGTSISSLSTQFVLVPVRAWSEGAPYNPTALPVQMAFISGWRKPVSEDWNAGAWASAPGVNGYYEAQCLVGPGTGGVSLAAGTYNLWLLITGNPEIPVSVPGTLTII